MASNRNSSPKDQGASEPNKKQSVDADATNVDWMIMSDLSTRIDGYPNPKPESKSSSLQVSSNQIDSDDLEDLAWLKSLDLDSPIERSPSQTTSGSEAKSDSLDDDDINEIDWLIVTNLKTRMDDSEIRAKASPIYQDIVQPNISIESFVLGDNLTEDILDDDLGLDGLEFLDNSDLDSLEFDTSEDININEFLNEYDLNISDGIQELEEGLNNDFDLSDNDWDQISEDIIDQSNEQSNLDIISESLEIETQISQGFNPTEEYYENIDPILDQLHNSEVVDEIQSDELIEDFSVNNQLQDTFQDVFVNEEVSNFGEGFDNELDDGFGEVKSLESLNNNIGEDEFWSSQPILDPEINANSNDDVFTDDWGQSNEIVVNDAIDDLVWDASTNDVADIISPKSIDNAFGTSDDWAIAPLAEQFEIGDHDDWSAGLEDEINSNTDFNFESISEDLVSNIEIPDTNDVVLDNEIVDVEEEDLKTSDKSSEPTNESLWKIDETQLQEESLDESWNLIDDFDEQNLSNEDWAIASNIPNNIDATDSINNISINDVQIYDDFNNISSNLDSAENFEYIDDQEQINQQQFNSQFDNQFNDQFDLYNSQDNAQSFEDNDFEEFENLVAQSEWENFSASFTAPITDTEIDDNFVINPLEASLDNQITTDWKADVSPFVEKLDDLESIIDENFDLATFDEEYFPETSLSDDVEQENIATMLTSNSVASNPYLENELASKFNHPSLSSDSSSVDELIASNDPFEEGLVNDLLNDVYSPVLIEDTSANSLLLSDNGYGSDVLDNLVPETEIASAPDLVSSSDSIVDMSDRDFLDDFDLDSISNHLTGEDFNSHILPSISTGLATPFPLSTPVAPVIEPEPTYSSINNPPPPPFLPPLPPKRSSSQGKAMAAPLPPSVPNVGFQSQPKNRNVEDDFDSFHIPQNPNKNRKSINSIDEGWSELLDADTVLSGVLRSPTEPSFSSASGATSPSSGRTAQGGRQNTSSNVSKNVLPDFNDLGLEIHGDNTDWSGLLDSSDLSDSITAISQQGSQDYSRARVGQTTPSRLDVTSNSETREIPRDRRKPMASFGDATQARMSATPDQMDFNRFTEDNYNSYGYGDSILTTPATPTPTSSPKVAFSQPKMTMPTINLESLWQSYLKIPAIGLGAIGGVFLLYSLLSRPVFDLGLRWGIFKDASGKDFTNADFKGAKLDNVDFSKANLEGAKMQDASLVGANFQGANLNGVNFTKANLNRARLIQASVIWAEFNNAQMNLVDLAEADLTRSNLANAKMEGVNLKGSKIGDQGTEKATKFSATTLLAWQIVNESREGRNLVEQNLSGLNLSFTSLKRANLSNSKLNYTDMTSTDLSGANLTGSQVNGANWSGAKLAGINLTDVTFDRNKLPKTDEETVCPNGKKGPCKF